MYSFRPQRDLISILLVLIVINFIPPSAEAQELIVSTDRNDSFTALSAYPLKQTSGSVDFQIHRPISPDYWSFRIGLSYGLLRTTEILVNLPYALDYENESGFQDITLVLKQVLLSERRFNPVLSVIGAYSVEGKKAVSTGGAYGGGVLLTKKIGPFLGNINLLYFHPQEDSLKDEYQLRIGGNISVSHDFRSIIDLLIKKSFYSDEVDHIESRFGYAVTLSPLVSSYAGFGYDLKGDIRSWDIFVRFNILYNPGSNER